MCHCMCICVCVLPGQSVISTSRLFCTFSILFAVLAFVIFLLFLFFGVCVERVAFPSSGLVCVAPPSSAQQKSWTCERGYEGRDRFLLLTTLLLPAGIDRARSRQVRCRSRLCLTFPALH